MILGKPLKRTAPNTVTANVIRESIIYVGFGAQASAGLLLIHPDIPAATGMSSSPIRATMAPIAAGGKTTPIQLVPAYLTNMPTRMKIIPVTINAPSARAYPFPG
ncbi:hypothetical protein D3C76_1209320 [compost metagenome]